MRPELERARLLGHAALSQLGLELRVLTGNQARVLALVQLAWFVTVALMQHFDDGEWETAAFFNLLVVVPALIPAVALGMAAVMGDRDSKQLEVTFVSPGGRYQVWAFRLAAIAISCLAPAALMSLAAKIVIDRDHQVIASFLHAIPPVAFVIVLTVAASVVFNGAAIAGLVVSGLLALFALFLHANPGGRRFDLFLNPFAPPDTTLDPSAWFRVLVFNRCFLLAATGLLLWLTLALLQRRERLL